MTPQDAWNAAYHQLELQLDRASFDTWLRSAVFLGYEAGIYLVGVPNGYARDMLQHRLYRNIRRVLSDVAGENCELRFEIYKGDVGEPEAPASDDMPLFKFMAQQPPAPAPEPKSLHQAVIPPQRPDLPESELNARYTIDRFIVNQSNSVVYEAALAVSDYPATVYNPFLIYGGVGLGKTHLLQSIAHRCAERGLKTVYIPSEVFTNDLIDAIRNRTTAMFRDKYRTVDVLLVDDIQFIAGKETTQEEFFHTFNALVNFNKQIVLASDRHPRELATLEDRLRSRFQGGLVADIQPPEYETRIAILQMWAQERGMELSSNVVDMIAHKAPNNVRELEGIFNQIAAQSRFSGGAVNFNNARETVERFRRPREHVQLDDIIQITADKHGLTIEELKGARRTGKINRARQIAMYIAREMTEYSLPQIGEAFGGRSHTTVLHGCNKINDELESDPILGNRIQKIMHSIRRGG
ncbi:chromosomal replication initiator protein DnaA [Phototrophicus methaneseepsis]|uniref:Chromosomal replication initiator protein DnaA n=1 Tax=Phototrophicus methaneseepsis TaxID=2710758 RepID=A0A7S8E9M4_9CHLR|nr:chromosomal replication initiator protein DnaA [Phototrophicus methaneseepsis]QPC82793.1 chromosomal replication initiator protein DnaA [Phototrophicus methaneseepsis]